MKVKDVVSFSLRLALVTCQGLKRGEDIVFNGRAFGDVNHDVEIMADRVIGQKLAKALLKVPGIGWISIEGFDDIEVGLGDYWVCIDQMDGSLNYLKRCGTLGLPYSTCVTVLRRRENATFADVVGAGVIDLRLGDEWLVVQTPDGYKTWLNSCPIKLSDPGALDLGRMIVFGELYYPSNRELLTNHVFAGQKGWLRNPGSAAYEMALVASGTAVAFISNQQKQHELGAGFALVKGAGGVAVDFEGVDLSSRPFTFVDQTPVVLAANRSIADQILSKLP